MRQPSCSRRLPERLQLTITDEKRRAAGLSQQQQVLGLQVIAAVCKACQETTTMIRHL